MLRVRVLTVDYAMAPPRAGVDVGHVPDDRRRDAERARLRRAAAAGGGGGGAGAFASTAAAAALPAELHAVPVLRVIGVTPAGQSVCLHVHQVFPYLFVPYPHPPTTAAEGAPRPPTLPPARSPSLPPAHPPAHSLPPLISFSLACMDSGPLLRTTAQGPGARAAHVAQPPHRPGRRAGLRWRPSSCAGAIRPGGCRGDGTACCGRAARGARWPSHGAGGWTGGSAGASGPRPAVLRLCRGGAHLPQNPLVRFRFAAASCVPRPMTLGPCTRTLDPIYAGRHL